MANLAWMAIPLTQGLYTLVDSADYNQLVQWKWHATKGGNTYYAKRNIGKWPNQITILMHQAIVNTPKDKEIDHANHNGLDNRRSNLRICSHSQNLCNQMPTTGCTSHYKGVYWHKNENNWMARIAFRGQRLYLGSFDIEIEAAKAYDKKAKELFGEFALTNF